MTNTGMFEDADKIEYLENQNKLLRKKLKESNLVRTLDMLETDIGIKDWHINKLKDEIKELKEALEKTEQGTMRHAKYFDKDLYSKFHRKYDGIAMCDVDSVEICQNKGCWYPLAIIEHLYDTLEKP